MARRHLQKLKLDSVYKGKEEVDGEYFDVEGSNPNPFTCVLDVGLARTTTGAKIFAVMKGVADGGIHIPHRFCFFSKIDSLKYGHFCLISVSRAFSGLIMNQSSTMLRHTVIVFLENMWPII